MTHQNTYDFVNEITKKGLEAIPELMGVLINNAMHIKSSKYLQAEQ